MIVQKYKFIVTRKVMWKIETLLTIDDNSKILEFFMSLFKQFLRLFLNFSGEFSPFWPLPVLFCPVLFGLLSWKSDIKGSETPITKTCLIYIDQLKNNCHLKSFDNSISRLMSIIAPKPPKQYEINVKLLPQFHYI